MKLFRGSVAAALGVLLLFATDGIVAQVPCPLDLPAGPSTTLIFVADPGDFSQTAEAVHYYNNLKPSKKMPAGITACPSVYVGKIMGQSVAVITTGIGPGSAGMCVYDVVSRCGSQVKDVIYSGTSGWSPQLGGVINNSTCEAGKANSNGKITRIGDVCISPFAVNWDCRAASFAETCRASPNQCNFPEQRHGPADSFLFGDCEFYNVTRGILSLAYEVIAVAKSRGRQGFPRRNDKIQKDTQTYWSRMSTGTKLAAPKLDQSAPPNIWTFEECMEIDSQYFWSGAPWDNVARKYVADTLNLGLKVAGLKPKTAKKQTDVIAVSAMEAIGLGMAMERYHGLTTTKRKIPYTNVRGMSNWVLQPLVYKGKGLWLEGAPVPEDFTNGYKYAISTSATVVLSTLQARCEKASATKAAAERGSLCAFTVKYP